MTNFEAGSDSADRELVLSHRIDAPRDRVFDAWTDPQHIGQWWGPNGFTTTIDAMDVRVGGDWVFMMHGPDGSDYPNRITYTDLVRPQYIGYDHGDHAGPLFKVAATFDEQGGGTALTLRMIGASALQVEEMKKAGAVEGGNQTLERLARYLACR